MRLLLSGVLTVAIAAGCGEDTIPLSEYVQRANEICRDNNTRGRAEAQRLQERLEADGELAPDEIVTLNRKVHEILGRGVDRLDEIPPPDDKQDAAEAYERAVRDAHETWGDLVDAQAGEDVERMRELRQRNEDGVREVKDRAGELGIDECD